MINVYCTLIQRNTVTQPEAQQPVPKSRTHGNVALLAQSIEKIEKESSTKYIPTGGTRILPPAVAPRPKQSKVCVLINHNYILAHYYAIIKEMCHDQTALVTIIIK